jgi:hypothetical protein
MALILVQNFPVNLFNGNVMSILVIAVEGYCSRDETPDAVKLIRTIFIIPRTSSYSSSLGSSGAYVLQLECITNRFECGEILQWLSTHIPGIAYRF